MLGFFVITLDAVVVNVALRSIRVELGGGIAGLQWVVDRRLCGAPTPAKRPRTPSTTGSAASTAGTGH